MTDKDALIIVSNEIQNCINYYNKLYNLNYNINELELIDIYNSLGKFEALFVNNKVTKKPVAIIFDRVTSEYDYNLYHKNEYKSLEDYIKDKISHEVTHLFDLLINKNNFKANIHGKWFKENYLPLRKRYTDSEFKIEYEPDGEYTNFGNIDEIYCVFKDSVAGIKLLSLTGNIPNKVDMWINKKYHNPSLLRIFNDLGDAYTYADSIRTSRSFIIRKEDICI